MPPTGLRDAKKEETRRQIAAAALRLFLEHGFEEVSIAQIAEAAHVSKMTVFNYFPAKESMFFEFAVERLPDLGRAVRERGPGVSPIAALHRYVRAELERRAEWTGFHDGVAEFARVIFSSPTLIEGFGRMWREGEQDLLAAFTEAAGLPEPVDLAQRLRAVWVGQRRARRRRGRHRLRVGPAADRGGPDRRHPAAPDHRQPAEAIARHQHQPVRGGDAGGVRRRVRPARERAQRRHRPAGRLTGAGGPSQSHAGSVRRKRS